MQSDMYVGHHCEKCGAKTGFAMNVGGKLTCSCGAPMQVDSSKNAQHVRTNVSCACGGYSCAFVITDGPITCPNCKKII